MKSTDNFKKAIQSHLNKVAEKDSDFAKKMENQDKNIDDCITYILNQVKKSGCNGFADEEIYGMALHYYDEEKVKVGKPIDSTVVVNHKVELTDDEIDQLKKEARDQVINEEKERLKSTPKKRGKKEEKETNVLSLF
ncbi:PcfK-like family protein [Mesonia aestuariivivens]|uniref:PcfK-like family protein n=1 Tax=Mesonia aestuariivivens TaxID=2796128 RepID=A0ABS6W177_9FLAO|nr:PcfK-like family protein [Mesonia aestuariivivens]MBW2961292.1 PcfK-like family protein [Mesonia aestuariivivens]